MGIDVYMTWRDRPADEHPNDAEDGYLRESYFRSKHYATRVLVPEAFGDCREEGGAKIPARLMADRTEAAVHAAHQRYSDDPEYADQHARAIVAFVELAKRKERETGEPVRVYASW